MKVKLMLLFVAAIFLGACSTASVKAPEKEPEIVSVLPRMIEGYSYMGSYVYPKEEYGYSIRYTLGSNNHADIYIYPVPEQLKKFSHNDIVFGMTGNAISEIALAQEKGFYHEFEILNKSAADNAGLILSKVEAKLVKNNLVSYTILYLTENGGKLIKARITMPDNEGNRSNNKWDDFIGEIFGFILSNIDKA